MDEFWIKNPSVLISDYHEIIPKSSMTRIKQMNTVSRFIIYLIIICIIFDAGDKFILYAFVVLILLVAFYYIYANDPIGFQKDLINENYDPVEKFTTENCEDCSKEKNLFYKTAIDIYDKDKDQILKGVAQTEKDIILESGYIDSDGNYKIGKDYTDIDIDEWKKQKNIMNKKIPYEKNKIYNESTCRKPSVSNPFTNIVFTDYLDASNVAEPCNSNDETVVQDMQNLYNSSIYRNVSDVFERENSQRMFYTLPIRTIPNDQTDFANWLYKTGPTCKENSQNCTYYEIPTMSSQRY